jgi:hypothetical protein
LPNSALIEQLIADAVEAVRKAHDLVDAAHDDDDDDDDKATQKETQR